MKHVHTALVLALLVTAQPANGGKPAPPSPGTSNPEIGYIRYNSGNRKDLILSNEDGTGASTIYSSKEFSAMSVAFGPRAHKTFALSQGNKISLGKYKQVATGLALDTLTPIGGAGGSDVEFSRDGDSIVYQSFGDIWRYDVSAGTHSKLVDMAGIGGGLSISRDSSTVYYVEEEISGVTALKSVPMAGGASTDLGLRGPYYDTEAARTKDELLLTASGNLLKRYDLATGTVTHVTNGYAAAYKCDDSRIVYVVANGSSLSILYRDEPSGAPGTLSTSGLYWPDFMPTC